MIVQFCMRSMLSTKLQGSYWSITKASDTETGIYAISHVKPSIEFTLGLLESFFHVCTFGKRQRKFSKYRTLELFYCALKCKRVRGMY